MCVYMPLHNCYLGDDSCWEIPMIPCNDEEILKIRSKTNHDKEYLCAAKIFYLESKVDVETLLYEFGSRLLALETKLTLYEQTFTKLKRTITDVEPSFNEQSSEKSVKIFKKS